MAKQKDSKHQLQGKQAKAEGKRFEQRLDAAFAYYREKGFALIEKTPEPMRVIKRLDNGKFLCVFEKRAQPDYKGVIKGGRTVVFEAKYTIKDRLQQNQVTPGQAAYLEQQSKLGARCWVLAGFSSGEVYCIPWAVWATMKELYGRKYVKETELEKYRVPLAWNGVLLILN